MLKSKCNNVNSQYAISADNKSTRRLQISAKVNPVQIWSADLESGSRLLPKFNEDFLLSKDIYTVSGKKGAT